MHNAELWLARAMKKHMHACIASAACNRRETISYTYTTTRDTSESNYCTARHEAIYAVRVWPIEELHAKVISLARQTIPNNPQNTLMSQSALTSAAAKRAKLTELSAAHILNYNDDLE